MTTYQSTTSVEGMLVGGDTRCGLTEKPERQAEPVQRLGAFSGLEHALERRARGRPVAAFGRAGSRRQIVARAPSASTGRGIAMASTADRDNGAVRHSPAAPR